MAPRGFVNLLLLAALAVACVVIGYFRFDPARRHPYLINDMVDSPAYEDEGENPVLPNGQTMQLPPPGAVPHGLRPLPYRAGSDEDMDRAGRDLRNPRSGAAATARGQEVFDRMCAVCHGPQGAGDGPVVSHGFPPPPNLMGSHTRGLADGALFYKITYGGSIMPAYASQVTRADRWASILWLRRLQATHAAPKEAVGGSGPGWDLIAKADCLACHAVDHKMVGPAYLDVAKKYAGDATALARLVKKVKTGGGGVWGTVVMAPHPKLTDDQISVMVQAILAAKPGGGPAKTKEDEEDAADYVAPAAPAPAPAPAPAAPAPGGAR